MFKKFKLNSSFKGILIWMLGFNLQGYAQNTEAPIVDAQGNEFYCPLTEQNIVNTFSITASNSNEVEACCEYTLIPVPLTNIEAL